MGGIDQILNTANWALHTHQLGITVTSHNVANVNTPGYSRQSLHLGPARPWSHWPPQHQSPGQVGTGVQAMAIRRVYDEFLGKQIQGEFSEKGRLDAQQQAFERLESIFSSVSDHDLGSDLNVFFSAWEDLSTHPEGSAERVAVREAGVELRQKISGHMEKLLDLQEEMDQSVQITVDRINELAAEIADLNEKIGRIEHGGEDANDLRDMRGKRLDELGKLIEITTWTDNMGMTTVVAPGGKPIVMENKSWELTTEETDPRQSDVFWLDEKGNKTAITNDIQSGSLNGYITMRDQQIPRQMSQLDELAQELIWAVNVEHAVSAGISPQADMTSQVPVAAGVSLNDPVNGPPFADRIQAGEMHIWTYDSSTPPVPQNQVVVNVNPAWTLEQLANDIQAQSGGSLVTTVNGDRTLTIQGVGALRFAIAQDDSNALAAIGLNTFFTGSEAQDIDLSSKITQDADLIGAGKVDDDGSLTGTAGNLSPGDNRAALAIAALRDTQLIGSSTLEGAFAWMVGEIGIQAAATYNDAEYQQLAIEQLEDQESSISGVSLDEEMLNLMKFQKAYEAAARLIQVGDEMLQTILDMK